MTKYAFEIKTLVMVEAESEDEAWEQVSNTAQDALHDFDYERSPENDQDAVPIKKIKAIVPSTVNHPTHYTSDPSGIECIEITRHRNFNVGNAMKYLWRNGLKDSDAQIEDLQKAIWYIQDEIKRLNK